MESEVIYRLARITEILRDDLPLSKSSVVKLLTFAKQLSPIAAILQLLCLSRDKFIKI